MKVNMQKLIKNLLRFRLPHICPIAYNTQVCETTCAIHPYFGDRRNNDHLTDPGNMVYLRIKLANFVGTD